MGEVGIYFFEGLFGSGFFREIVGGGREVGGGSFFVLFCIWFWGMGFILIVCLFF